MKILVRYLLLKKTFVLTTILVFGIPVLIWCQGKDFTDCIPYRLSPIEVVRENKTVTYKITTDYFNHDIFGNFFNKTQVIGQYARGLADKKVEWTGVFVSEANKKNEVFPQGVRQTYMEHRRYNPSAVTSDSNFFKDFPQTDLYGKALVWDMFTLEGFAWSHLDSLQLNIPYLAHEYNVKVSLNGAGNFTNSGVKLIWTGVSVMNGRKCALIQFEALENPFSIEMKSIISKGRSHYWGNIWLALEDGQIEAAWLNEDVVMDVQFSGGGVQLMNTVRKLLLEKIKL